MATKRKAVGKKTRFEVFKRDSFTCQYCGAKAPDVVLHADHIHPVSKGGGNDLLNLITSCEGCNSGKSNRSLGDSTVVKKRMSQAGELQSKREQVEMIAEWQRGLGDVESAALSEAIRYFSRLTGGWGCETEGAVSLLRKSIPKYGLAYVMSQMRARSASHLRFETGESRSTNESANIMLRSFMNDLKYKESNEKDPEGSAARYAAGIARNRLYYVPYNHREVFIGWARAGIPSSELRDAAQSARNWTTLYD